METWKKTRLKGGTYSIKPLLVHVFENGKCIYNDRPTVLELRDICRKDLDTLWDESKRLVNPNKVHVDLSKPLYELKQQLLDKYRNIDSV